MFRVQLHGLCSEYKSIVVTRAEQNGSRFRGNNEQTEGWPRRETEDGRGTEEEGGKILKAGFGLSPPLNIYQAESDLPLTSAEVPQVL